MTTDLIAQAEAARHPETIFVWLIHDPEYNSGGWNTDPTMRNIRYVRGDKADALIARIRELEGERERSAQGYREDLNAIADVSVERLHRAEAAEATVASLKEQVETMRGAAYFANHIGLEEQADDKSLVYVTVGMMRGLRAALTTENPNG